MIYFIAALVIAGILAPFFGADSRDGRDWTPGHFEPRKQEQEQATKVRRSDSPARTSSVPAAVAARRTTPTAC
jgi:hypothetical protein